MEGYSCNRADRNCSGGGVATYIKADLNPTNLDSLQEEARALDLEITISAIELSRGRSLIVIGAYRPPSARMNWFTDFDSILLKLLTLGQIVIMGDLNADLCKNSAPPTRALKSSLKLAGVRIENTLPTRIQGTSATCLDIIAVDNDLVCLDYVISDLSASDHFPVSATLQLKLKLTTEPILRRNFKKIDIDKLGCRLKEIAPGLNTNTNVNDAVTVWHRNFMKILDDAAPLRQLPRRKKPTPPWFNEDIQFHIGRRDWLGSKLKNCNPEDKKSLENEIKEARKMVKGRIRRAQIVEGSRALQNPNSREVWKFIRAATFSTKGKADTPIEPEILNKALAAIVQANTDTPLSIPKAGDRPQNFEFKTLSVAHVTHILSTLKPNTATGPDELPAALLRNLAPVLGPTIAHFFNESLSSGSFPDIWKRAEVIPIYKSKGSKTDPGNYRPISILPVLGRALEKVAASQLYDYCEKNVVIPSQQFGFRKESSCEMALVSAMDYWLRSVDEGKYAGALLLDLSKAFDCVPHQKLLQELSMAGAGDSALKWFASYLSGRQQRVRCREITTHWLKVTRGVPQGSCLSPLLFSIYVRDLPSISDSECIQFADDVTESAADSNIEVVAQTLTASFTKTKEFCDAKELIVNSSKTQLVIFKASNKKIPEDFNLLIDANVIKPSNSAKLLGFTIDRHFTGGDHIDAVIRKCSGLLGVLRRAAPCLPRELLRLAYISLIRSHLEYASAVLAPYSSTQLAKLDTVQRKAARIIMGLPRDAHAAPLLENLRLPSLESRRRHHIVDLVERALSGHSHPTLGGFFRRLGPGGLVTGDCTARVGAGRKRFRVHRALVYNECSSGVVASLP